MKPKLIGTITDKKILNTLGFPEGTKVDELIQHWQNVERTYELNRNRAEKVLKTPIVNSEKGG